MRVGVIALLHESNTFVDRLTTLEDFQANLLLNGEEVRQRLLDSHHEVGGFFAGLTECGLEAVPIFAARALPSGTIAADAFEQIVARMLASLQRAGPLDGLLVAVHGATASENHADADGYWLNLMRQRQGPEFPIIGTLDAHANLSPRMVTACDALIAYRTNPHLDQRARGREAAQLLAQTLRGDARPTMAASFPPMAIDIERQATDEPPCRELLSFADALKETPRVLSNSVLLGFPYADVDEMGSATICVTDDDRQLASEQANELASWMWRHREQCVGGHVGVDASLAKALSLDGPVCLLDMGDNVGGGSPGDGTLLAHALHNRRLPATFVCICDADSVAAAAEAGLGHTVPLAVGGKSDEKHGAPLAADFTIVGVYDDGRFEELEPRHGGTKSNDQGRTAVVRTRHGLTIMLTSRRMPPFSLRQLTTFGVDPGKYRILVAKGVNAPLAAYGEVCRHFIRVNTPGVTASDMRQLDYRHRRRPMWPFEADAVWVTA